MTEAASVAAGAAGPTPASLARLVAETTRALARYVRADGVLIDAATGAPTPPDHYGATFAALALAVADADDPRWHALLARWKPQRSSARGHGPFNRLALILLAEHFAHRRGGRPVYGALANGPAARTLEARRLDAASRYRRLRRHPSNNWLLLEHACDVLESVWSAASASREGRLHDAGAVFDADCARWLTPAGGFFDYPARLGAGPLAAPLCYHAKCAALLALVCRAAPSSEREQRLATATRWLAALLDERSGHLGGHGRSSHALFGSACALFVSLGVLARSANPRERAAHAQRIDALCAALEAGRRDDGLLSLTPSGEIGMRGGWDAYMHLSVYNAWAAGLLGWLCARVADAPPRDAGTARGSAAQRCTQTSGAAHEVFVDPVAGLAACRGKRTSVFLSLRGGVVQDFDAGEADFRSAGLLPFHLSYEGRAQLAPPLRVARAMLLESPQLAGFTPIFRVGDALYGLARFDGAEVHEGPAGSLLALGWASPTRLHDGPSRARGVRRWIDALDARLCGGRLRRRRALEPRRLEGHRALRAFAFDGDSGRFALATLLRGRPSQALWLNPLGHGWIETGSRVTVACRDGAPVAMTRSVPLSGALAGAVGSCSEPVLWPEQDALWLLACGPGGDATLAAQGPGAVLQLDLARGLVITPWTTLPLPPPGW